MKKVQDDIQILLVPLGILFVVVVLMLFSAKFIFDRVGSLNQELSDNQKTENMLKLKLTSLQAVDQQISTESEASTFALPGSNSVLDAVSQVQNEANGLSLNVTNLNSQSSAAAPNGNGINSTDLSFDADGSFDSIANFIKKIKNSTPITIFDTIKITNQNASGNSLYRLTAALTSYWAPLPKTIPAITEPIEALTADEQKILTQVSALQRPVSAINVGSSSGAVSPVGVGKTNPFQ